MLESRTSATALDESGRIALETATAPLWQAVTVFRVLAMGYVLVTYFLLDEYFDRPVWGWIIVTLMGAWTLTTALAYRTTTGRRPPLVVADVLVACLAMAATPFVDDPARISLGEPTLALVWPAAGVLAAAVRWGLPGGVAAASATSAASLAARGEFSWVTNRNVVLLMVTGLVVGYTAGLFRSSQRVLIEALRIEAAGHERDRLSRSVHDGVLQALAIVQRQAGALGGEGPELARLAGEQELALRLLLSTAAVTPPTGATDLSQRLASLESSSITVSRPLTAVLLSEGAAVEVMAAVSSAVENATRHAGEGARVWILLEEQDGQVIVTVRDDGVGFNESRLAEARSAGRMGVSGSIIGRIRDLGGSVTIESQPDVGTEVEIRLTP